jgi:molybdopterin molybdotransferase
MIQSIMVSGLQIPCSASISFDAAQEILRTQALPLNVEHVPLSKAGRRVLAAPVVAKISSPRQTCAAMDGFAVLSQDLAADVRQLRLVGSSAAGAECPDALLPGTAIAVSTGAPVPANTGRVVIREHVRLDGYHIDLLSSSQKTHLRERASDFTEGDILVAEGTVIDPRTLVVIAAADVGEVTAWRRPRVHVLSNGDELAAPGHAAANLRHIPDSLTEGLLLMARQWGAIPVGADRVLDDVAAVRRVSARALDNCDILLLAGGASHGNRDFARAALSDLGLECLFAGVAMKPGKPTWYGRIGNTHVIGLPGNPTAAITAARLFLAPLLTAVSGRSFDDALQWNDLPSDVVIAPGGERDQFLCAAKVGATVRIIERQEASSQMMLAQADMLVERRAYAPAMEPGEMLRCLRF